MTPLLGMLAADQVPQSRRATSGLTRAVDIMQSAERVQARVATLDPSPGRTCMYRLSELLAEPGWEVNARDVCDAVARTSVAMMVTNMRNRDADMSGYGRVARVAPSLAPGMEHLRANPRSICNVMWDGSADKGGDTASIPDGVDVHRDGFVEAAHLVVLHAALAAHGPNPDFHQAFMLALSRARVVMSACVGHAMAKYKDGKGRTSAAVSASAFVPTALDRAHADATLAATAETYDRVHADMVKLYKNEDDVNIGTLSGARPHPYAQVCAALSGEENTVAPNWMVALQWADRGVGSALRIDPRDVQSLPTLTDAELVSLSTVAPASDGRAARAAGPLAGKIADPNATETAQLIAALNAGDTITSLPKTTLLRELLAMRSYPKNVPGEDIDRAEDAIATAMDAAAVAFPYSRTFLKPVYVAFAAAVVDGVVELGGGTSRLHREKCEKFLVDSLDSPPEVVGRYHMSSDTELARSHVRVHRAKTIGASVRSDALTLAGIQGTDDDSPLRPIERCTMADACLFAAMSDRDVEDMEDGMQTIDALSLTSTKLHIAALKLRAAP